MCLHIDRPNTINHFLVRSFLMKSYTYINSYPDIVIVPATSPPSSSVRNSTLARSSKYPMPPRFFTWPSTKPYHTPPRLYSYWRQTLPRFISQRPLGPRKSIRDRGDPADRVFLGICLLLGIIVVRQHDEGKHESKIQTPDNNAAQISRQDIVGSGHGPFGPYMYCRERPEDNPSSRRTSTTKNDGE